MPIDKINDTSFSAIAEANDTLKASIANVIGVDAPSSVQDIVFADQTSGGYSGPWNTTTPYAAPLPSTASSGDFVMLLFSVDMPVNFDVTTTPTGWTKQVFVGNSSSDVHCMVFTRELDGTEGSTVNLFPIFSGFSFKMLSFSFICENIDTTSPIGANATEIDTVGTGMTIPAATSGTAGSFIVFVGYDGADGLPITMTNNGGFTLTTGQSLNEPTSGGGSGVSSQWRYAAIPATTSTGTTSVTFSGTDGKVGIHLLLQRV